MAIRDARLYRASHETFEDYCRDRWGMSRGRANQLVRAAQTVAALDTTVSTPESEAQLRPLAPLDPPQQREAWSEAVASAPNGKPTAKDVAKAAERIAPRQPDPDPSPEADDCVADQVEVQDEPDYSTAEADTEGSPEADEPIPSPSEPRCDPLPGQTSFLDGSDDLPAMSGQSAQRWRQRIEALRHQADDIIRSLPRRGGISILTRDWPKEQIVATVSVLSDLRNDILPACIKTLKEAASQRSAS